jgi:secondary thiamine-phosphate synthase enzyme
MAMHSFTIDLAPRPRGVHLVTREILAAIDADGVELGLLHLFLQHTSAGLTLGENASPEVRTDLERWFRRLAPDGAAYFEHTLEGADDMPAHAKAAVVGASLTLPWRGGRAALGRWQGIYLCEFRERGGPRTVLATVVD